VRDFIIAPRGRHSEKPQEQYARIEALFPGPFVELYARTRRLGWVAWGDELPALESPREKSSALGPSEIGRCCYGR
jgi:N6-adenosine-specific RNA methylase IME4